MQLRNVKSLVTGGGTGIGLEVARRVVDAGGRVAICGRRADVLERAAAELGERAAALRADVRDEAEVVRLVREAEERMGGLNVLVNNAATGHRATLLELEREAFEAVWATNVVGAMLVGREVARRLVERGEGGTIVNVGSTAARRGYAGGTAYVASKFALTGMTECWRAELRKHDVRVMQIDPSEVQTPFGGRDMSHLDPRKLTASEIAHVVTAMLELEDRGFVPEVTVWATNPGG